VCGMSSWLVQVTSVPLLPTSDRAAAGSSKQVSNNPEQNSLASWIPSACQWCVDNGAWRFHRHQTDFRRAQAIVQFASRNGHRARTLRDAGHALREGGGAGCVEHDIALDLLHHLMDVPVQHGDGPDGRRRPRQCGIVAGDIILRYGSMEVKDVRALARAIARTIPSVVDLLVWHNEEPTVIAATVKELASTVSPTPDIPTPPTDPIDPGLNLAPIDDATRHAFRPDRGLIGVVVTQVAPDGTAAEAGLNPGDVLVELQPENVGLPEDVARLMTVARQQQRRYVAMLVHDADGLRSLALSLD
jgi:hypothetical protein